MQWERSTSVNRLLLSDRLVKFEFLLKSIYLI
jgi:hypothetical protein